VTSASASVERQYDILKENYPDVAQEVGNIFAAHFKIEQLANESPKGNVNGFAWRKLAHRAEADRNSLCRHLNGKAVFTGLVHLYTTTHREMVVCSSRPQGHTTKCCHEDFKEQKRRKRRSSDEQPKEPKRAAIPTTTAMDQRIPFSNGALSAELSHASNGS
jgi:hypothetical protein